MADLDQGGVPRIWQRQYLGPSVGWTASPSDDSSLLITASGTYNIDLSTRYVAVDTTTASGVIINLPTAADPPIPAIAMPGPYVNSSIIVTDIGGNVGHLPITINPKAGETIIGQPSIQITSAYGYCLLIPNNTHKLWNTSSSANAITFGNIVVPPSGDTSGATDYSNITTALANVARGAVVQLLSGTYYVNNTLIISRDNTGIVGAGGQSIGAGDTQIQVIGNFTGVKVSRTGAQVACWTLTDFNVFFFSGTSNVGVQIDSSSSGLCENVSVTQGDGATVGFLLRSDQNATVNGNTFINCNTFVGNSAANAIGWKLDTSVVGQDCDFNQFFNCSAQLNLASQVGWVLAGCDTNAWYGGGVFADSSIAAIAVKFDYTGVGGTGWPGGNAWWGGDFGFNMTAGAAAFVNVGSPSPSGFSPNRFYDFGTGNGAKPNYNLANTEFLTIENDWAFSTPAVTSTGGSGLVATSGLYLKVVGRSVYFNASISVSSVGSATGGLVIPLGFTTPNNFACSATDAANAGGNACSGLLSSGNLTIFPITAGAIQTHQYCASGVFTMNM